MKSTGPESNDPAANISAVQGTGAFDELIERRITTYAAQAMPEIPGAVRKLLLETLRIGKAFTDRRNKPLHVRESSRRQIDQFTVVDLDFQHDSTGRFSGRLFLPGATGPATLLFPDPPKSPASFEIEDLRKAISAGKDPCALDTWGPILVVGFDRLAKMNGSAEFSAAQLRRGSTKTGVQLIAAVLALDYLTTLPEATPCALRVDGRGAGSRYAVYLMLVDERISEIAVDRLDGRAATENLLGKFDDPYDLPVPNALRLKDWDDPRRLREYLPGRGLCVRETRLRIPVPAEFFPCAEGRCLEVRKTKSASSQCPEVPPQSEPIIGQFPSDPDPMPNLSAKAQLANRVSAKMAILSGLRLAGIEEPIIDENSPNVRAADGRKYLLERVSQAASDDALLIVDAGSVPNDRIDALCAAGFVVYRTPLPLAERPSDAARTAVRLLQVDRTLGGVYTAQVLETAGWLKSKHRTVTLLAFSNAAPVARYASILSDMPTIILDPDDGLLTLPGWGFGPAPFESEMLDNLVVPASSEILHKLRQAGLL